MANVLEVKNLNVGFDGIPIVQNLSFNIDQGESLAIIGPNGSGKTVLLKSLLGIVPRGGEVKWAPGAAIGYVPQKIDADRHLPLNLKNLMQAKGAVLGFAKNKTDAATKELPREVGLGPELLETSLGHLSGGQFQKALIAFALMGNPNVMLLDEPTASIDIPGEEQIYELIHRLQDEHGITVILVSHDLSFVYKYATKVLCLNKTGMCFGPPEEALSKDVLEKLYGEHKYFHHFHDKNNRHDA